MAGYANQVVRVAFPELSQDPVNDPIWVIIRNPRLMAPQELRANVAGAYDEEGKILDPDKAQEATHIVLSRLVVAARVYDPRVLPTFDPVTGEQTGDATTLLPPPPWTPETVAVLPSQIQLKLAQEMAEAQDPKQGPDSPTAKTSSGPPSPSTTEPGAAAQPPPS